MLSASVLIVLGAMVARTAAARLAAGAAAVVSVAVAVLTWWYFRTNVVAPVVAGYGFYLSAACIVGVIGCSIWALAATLASGDGRSADRVPVG